MPKKWLKNDIFVLHKFLKKRCLWGTVRARKIAGFWPHGIPVAVQKLFWAPHGHLQDWGFGVPNPNFLWNEKRWKFEKFSGVEKMQQRKNFWGVWKTQKCHFSGCPGKFPTARKPTFFRKSRSVCEEGLTHTEEKDFRQKKVRGHCREIFPRLEFERNACEVNLRTRFARSDWAPSISVTWMEVPFTTRVRDASQIYGHATLKRGSFVENNEGAHKFASEQMIIGSNYLLREECFSWNRKTFRRERV